MSAVRRALGEAARAFESISDTPRLDAELLMAHALGVSREAMLLSPPNDAPDGFASLVKRRAAGQPIAYIVGRRGFWSIAVFQSCIFLGHSLETGRAALKSHQIKELHQIRACDALA